ncbi:MAG: hypothetical protein ABSH36_05430 [Solirubrobacteraceae bacterium]
MADIEKGSFFFFSRKMDQSEAAIPEAALDTRGAAKAVALRSRESTGRTPFWGDFAALTV